VGTTEILIVKWGQVWVDCVLHAKNTCQKLLGGAQTNGSHCSEL